MWLKQTYNHMPFRHQIMFLYCYFVQGAWRAGRTGFIWAQLRAQVYKMIDIKTKEMKTLGQAYHPPVPVRGTPHPDVMQVTEDMDNE